MSQEHHHLAATSSGSPQSIFDLMGHNVFIQQIHRHIHRVARTNLTVIAQGETGTGKELVARFIHDHSQRAGKPFVAIDCGTIPDDLAESELFGYVRGAFTGAQGNKAGYFDMAQGGTLFLDEVANLSPTTQMKLLRSLQERHIFPLGSETSRRVDVRLIVASNVILEDAVRAGRFRADLFHRLNEFKIGLVPLRQRKEDILFLAERFRRETNLELRKTIRGFSTEACAYLLSYDWPGNVRELRNAVRHATLLSTEVIERKHLRQVLSFRADTNRRATPQAATETHPGHGLRAIVHELSAQLEKGLIQHALQETNGNKRQAAKLLQIGYKTLQRKLKAYPMVCLR